MNLNKEFDVVMMLTWSDWDKEPRSNRFHYATRFAKELPTLFFQTTHLQKNGMNIRPSGYDNLEIIEISKIITDFDIQNIKKLMRNRGFINPLIWVYDPLSYISLMRAMPNGFRVFHATEDYLIESEVWDKGISNIAQSVIELLKEVNFVVYVSKGLEKSYTEIGGYNGAGVVIQNGCDAEFFMSINSATKPYDADSRPSIVYQGGINNRIDYSLLLSLIKSMPDWDFKFCGKAIGCKAWKKLHELQNVHYFGELTPEALAFQMHSSTVGIIPFIQDNYIKNSLPLKAYEYVACGLPVVTVPITELQTNPDIFSFATNAAEFEEKIRCAKDGRSNMDLIKKRYEVSLDNSYNNRFNYLKIHLLKMMKEVRSRMLISRFRIAVLYDSNSTHIPTIKEYLEAFKEYSGHEVLFIPASSTYWEYSSDQHIDLSIFDVVIIHYSIRLSLTWHLSVKVAEALKVYQGLKLLFIQDEYEGTETARCFMDDFNFDIVYTCIPPEYIDKIYPSYRYPSTQFVQVLTGYVSKNNLAIESYAKPLKDRNIDIAYRGRNLPYIYGKLGHEKFEIGVQVKRLSLEFGLKVDIEVESEKRIYGSKWHEFLGSAKATLGTESGSNIFDVTGEIQKEIDRFLKASPNTSFEEIHAKLLSSYEDEIKMNQISPKIFEAIQLRTALILFEGSYSGVIFPEIHYIPLKKDYSNIREVFEKLKDDYFIERLTDRAYNDVIASDKFSYESFINKVNFDIASKLLSHPPESKIFATYYKLNQAGEIAIALPKIPMGIYSGAYPPLMAEHIGFTTLKEGTLNGQVFKTLFYSLLVRPDVNSFTYRAAKKIWLRLPTSFQIWLRNFLRR